MILPRSFDQERQNTEAPRHGGEEEGTSTPDRRRPGRPRPIYPRSLPAHRLLILRQPIIDIETHLFQSALLFGAAFLAGGVNAVAGGGILLVFPALLGLGVPAVVANATSTVALWPAALSSLWGYRREMAGSGAWLLRFGAVSGLGGWAGARLLLDTRPALFEALVPFLILGASLLFMAQEPLSRRLRARDPTLAGAGEWDVSRGTKRRAHALSGLLFQFAVAVYGGYFGAGIGILMLAALGLMGMDRIHRMNGVKNVGAACINGVASAAFLVGGAVDARLALVMAAGSILGGYAGARTARRLGAPIVRRLVTAIGLLIGLSMLLRAR